MGTNYSAVVEEPNQANQGHWREYTISEIDSESDDETASFADDNRNVQLHQQLDEQLDDQPNQQDEYESNQEVGNDESEVLSNDAMVAPEEPALNFYRPMGCSEGEINRVPPGQHGPRSAPEQIFQHTVAWGPPPVSNTVISEEPRINPLGLAPTQSDENEDELESFFRELGLGEHGGGGGGGRSTASVISDQVSAYTDAATTASNENDSFVPQQSRNFEWMGRSLESLVSGYSKVAPILGTPAPTREERKKRNHRRKGKGKELGFESLASSPSRGKGKSRRRSLERCLDPFASSSSHRYNGSHSNPKDGVRSQRKRGGPNVSLNLLARETTGKRIAPNNRIPAPDRLKSMGGAALYDALDRPSAGMCSEVASLEEAIDDGDWTKTQAVIARLSPRLIGDPTAAFLNPPGGNGNSTRDNDPNLPPTAPRFYAGGGRIGLERDAFVLAGGIDVLVRVFREPCFVGTEMALSYDARDLSKELVATNRLGHCWNETLACLRELVYSMPSLLETERVFDHEKDDFLPFLFTLLSHDPFFDGAAALIEEILSLQSHSPQPEDQQQEQQPSNSTGSLSDEGCGSSCACNNGDEIDGKKVNDNDTGHGDNMAGNRQGPTVRVPPPSTFFLGNVPDLYSLWGGFNCRQLAHFCRILALLIFEPEDRQLLESPAVLKSIELLQLRRNRAARAGRDSTVDMNQSILLGDERLVKRFLDLLSVMNFAPPLRCSSPFHIMAHFPYIADTLMMLGLHEFEDWDDVSRYEKLARKSLFSTESGTRRELHDLGSVAGMLENLSDAFMNNEGEPTNQLGHIITVIGAAQQAGVVVGRTRQRTGARGSTRDHQNHNGDDEIPRRDNGLESLASAAGILTDQVLLRRQEHALTPNDGTAMSASRSRIISPEDAANIMQFNSLLLAPYQVEVLFVLCTLLGGRRKVDAQELLKHSGITRILDDMFQRLPWDSLSPTREPLSHRGLENQQHGTDGSNEEQPGIHGPGCECTPESALCVQYLRLLHNFCDRDCDNYHGRRLLLSSVERRFIFEDCHIGTSQKEISKLTPGLLSKVIAAFVGESDESPYRFWLASCVESYLRGSSSVEQVFVAKTGLVEHLINDITSQRLHCAGSLQTSFDLLGELCKGNIEVLRLLVGYLDDEEKFRKLMSVAASNLVDSNVFIRSLLLSLERMSCGKEFHDGGISEGFDSGPQQWNHTYDVHSRSFLTHSWWETNIENPSYSELNLNFTDPYDAVTESELRRDQKRASDWFPTIESQNKETFLTSEPQVLKGRFDESYGRFGWVYKPESTTAMGTSPHGPNTIDRLSWFLSANRTRLLRDLLEVVNLSNINHENICCLNTAVVITIFANRRHELDDLLRDLKQMDDEENKAYSHHAKLTEVATCGMKHDIRKNFREVLWFWIEYYTHRGRDRLSLEFSSRLRFNEWMEVVSLLAADNGAPTALVRRPLSLPQSPYQRIA